MHKFVATVCLTVALIIGIGLPANASSVTETENHFSWSTVFYKAIAGMLIAAPAIVYFSLNNRKDD